MDDLMILNSPDHRLIPGMMVIEGHPITPSNTMTTDKITDTLSYPEIHPFVDYLDKSAGDPTYRLTS
jgi:hypothetical protein